MASGYTAWMRRHLSSLRDFELEAGLLRLRIHTAKRRAREAEKMIRLRKELAKRTTFGPDKFSARYVGPMPSEEAFRAAADKERTLRRGKVRARKLAKRQRLAATGGAPRQVTAA